MQDTKSRLQVGSGLFFNQLIYHASEGMAESTTRNQIKAIVPDQNP